MEFLRYFCVQWQFFTHWLEDLGFLNPIGNRMESVPEANQTECLPVDNQKIDMSQQTDDIPETQRLSAREEELTEQVNDLQKQLNEAFAVSEERNRKARKLERDLGLMASQHDLEIANLTRRKTEEIVAKEIELMNFKDECDERIVDLELSNAKLMEKILTLETEQASVPHSVPSCKKQSAKLDDSLAKIESIQEHLSSLDVVTEHSKWTFNYVLEQIKDNITSVTYDDPLPDEEKEKLIKDSQTIKSEMETVKLALADAMKTIVEMEERQSLLISSESQMKTTVDAKDSLLAYKDTELEQLRASVEQAKCKPQVTTRDVGCCTHDLPQPPVVQRRDVGCSTEDLPQLPAAKGKDVGCATDDLPQIPVAKGKDVVCAMDAIPPVPAIKERKASSPGVKKQSADEREQRKSPEHQKLFSDKVKESLKKKVEAGVAKEPEPKHEKKIEKDKSPAEAESVLETVKEALSQSKFPPLAAKAPAPRPPIVKVNTPVAETKFPSSDVRYKNKPMEGYTHNPLDGTTIIFPEPRKQANATPPAGFVIISKEIKQTERSNTLVLSDIPQVHYGRVVGRGGENVRRMQQSHAVAMSMVASTNQEEFYNMIIRGGNREKRQAAAREVIESLPVTIECSAYVDLKKLKTKEFQDLIRPLFVHINRPTKPKEKVKIFGRISDCRKVFDLLVNDIRLPTPPK